MTSSKREVIKDLQTLKNIGPIMARELYSLGVKTAQQMRSSNPEKLFARLKKIKKNTDPCELYIFRGAVLDKPWWECKGVNSKGQK